MPEAHPRARAPAWRIRTDRCELRPWAVADTAALASLHDRNRDHLRPSMPWADDSTDEDAIVARILRFHAAFAAGQDYIYAVFHGGAAIGGAGLHPRVGPQALEIGYWIDAGHEGRGLVSEATRALTRVAFRVHGVDRVEIRMDPGNARSAAVPRRLGFVHEVTLPRRFEGPAGLRDQMVWTRYAPSAGTLEGPTLEAWDVLGRRLV